MDLFKEALEAGLARIDSLTNEEIEAAVDQYSEEAITALVAQYKLDHLGSTVALTPTSALVLLVNWHIDEVTTPVEALDYAALLVTSLADDRYAIVAVD